MLPDFIGIIFTAFISLVIINFSPLSGKLGFSIVLVLTAMVVSGLINLVRRDKKAAFNAVTTVLIYVTGTFLIIPVFSIVFEIIVRGVPGLSFGMFANDMSVTSADAAANEGGLLHAIIGTAYLIIFASLISVPIGVLTALYLTEIKGRFSSTVRFFVQAMSGVPSVVAGLFIFAAIILTTPLKASGVVGAFSLSILMIPTVTRTAQEVLNLVPNDLREAGLAMGATQWRTVASIVVPAARNGLLTATILGVARIAGETAPLIFTIGGSDKLNLNPFKDYQGALPFYVWKGLLLGTPESIQRAWTGILILLMLVLTLFTLARRFGSRKAG